MPLLLPFSVARGSGRLKLYIYSVFFCCRATLPRPPAPVNACVPDAQYEGEFMDLNAIRDKVRRGLRHQGLYCCRKQLCGCCLIQFTPQ